MHGVRRRHLQTDASFTSTTASLPPISRFILNSFNFRVRYGETDYQADFHGSE
ncbi:hypothetical protein NEOLEDRAFT_1136282 [Neolentinus lepideus HHB14362 ss-1]|uniref:Uncharacterized protein n=1 Tax=Neolentinus lepideus HHB14362 ss-1 TaxID=1314782 RepID=A0A165R9Z9_9AGAM|nr:hypothetical protein NEOLEDRAFT_1136282 [Neolentinus lepideus HHB14362 ss-1]